MVTSLFLYKDESIDKILICSYFLSSIKCFQHAKRQIFVSIVMLLCFSHSYIIANWIYSGFWLLVRQNDMAEDVTLKERFTQKMKIQSLSSADGKKTKKQKHFWSFKTKQCCSILWISWIRWRLVFKHRKKKKNQSLNGFQKMLFIPLACSGACAATDVTYAIALSFSSCSEDFCLKTGFK